MAEVIFSNLVKKNKRKDIIVKSAGTFAQTGSDMTDLSRKALVQCGEKLPSKKHSATQFTNDMHAQFDRIVDLREFNDPWGGTIDDYVKVCKELQEYCKALYNETCKT